MPVCRGVYGGVCRGVSTQTCLDAGRSGAIRICIYAPVLDVRPVSGLSPGFALATLLCGASLLWPGPANGWHRFQRCPAFGVRVALHGSQGGHAVAVSALLSRSQQITAVAPASLAGKVCIRLSRSVVGAIVWQTSDMRDPEVMLVAIRE